MSIAKATPTELSATQLLESLRVSVKHNIDDIDFKEYYANDIKSQVFVLSWFDYDLDHEIVVRSKASVTSISNYENCCYDYDIDSLDIYSITVGAGIYKNSIATPECFNEHTLAPLISEYLDHYNEDLDHEESAYSINLVSESPDKRGSNWIMVA